MFTIRHVDGTVDNLYQADRVTFFDHPTNTTNIIPEPHSVIGALELRNFPDTFIAGLWGGMAYVMNDQGATVARYDLPFEPAPRKAPLHPLDSRFDNIVE
jgi:hypothetical protein